MVCLAVCPPLQKPRLLVSGQRKTLDALKSARKKTEEKCGEEKGCHKMWSATRNNHYRFAALFSVNLRSFQDTLLKAVPDSITVSQEITRMNEKMPRNLDIDSTSPMERIFLHSDEDVKQEINVPCLL
jgi:hypothetical protein